MAGLVPAIHVFMSRQHRKDVDRRDKPGDDETPAALKTRRRP
jgi:hypothetical protein